MTGAMKEGWAVQSREAVGCRHEREVQERGNRGTDPHLPHIPHQNPGESAAGAGCFPNSRPGKPSAMLARPVGKPRGRLPSIAPSAPTGALTAHPLAPGQGAGGVGIFVLHLLLFWSRAWKTSPSTLVQMFLRKIFQRHRQSATHCMVSLPFYPLLSVFSSKCSFMCFHVLPTGL